MSERWNCVIVTVWKALCSLYSLPWASQAAVTKAQAAVRAHTLVHHKKLKMKQKAWITCNFKESAFSWAVFSLAVHHENQYSWSHCANKTDRGKPADSLVNTFMFLDYRIMNWVWWLTLHTNCITFSLPFQDLTSTSSISLCLLVYISLYFLRNLKF